jgi:Kef-type K+ transport system membrane component KefB
MMLRFAKAAGLLLGHVVVFDILGVIGCFVFDLFGVTDGGGIIYAYLIWFVAGVFCGGLGYLQTGSIFAPESPNDADWADLADADVIGRRVIFATLLVTVLVSIPCYFLQWRLADNGPYVPDNEALSLIYLGTIFATTIFMHRVLRPRRRKDAGSSPESPARGASSN